MLLFINVKNLLFSDTLRESVYFPTECPKLSVVKRAGNLVQYTKRAVMRTLPPVAGELALVEAGNLLAVDAHQPGGGGIHAPQDVQHRRSNGGPGGPDAEFPRPVLRRRAAAGGHCPSPAKSAGRRCAAGPG